MEDVNWNERNRFLSSQIAFMIQQYSPRAKLGLDVGSQTGQITSNIVEITGIKFCGIEPFLSEIAISARALKNGIKIQKAWAHNLPFNDGTFDVVTLTSVYEYFSPDNRLKSVKEIYRVLRPGGILVGQIPNMNFPIDLHSRLLLQQFLPRKIGELYFRNFSKVPWKNKGVNWYRVGTKQIRENAIEAGFQVSDIRIFNYPKEIYPYSMRRFYFLLSLIPTGYTFTFRKPL